MKMAARLALAWPRFRIRAPELVRRELPVDNSHRIPTAEYNAHCPNQAETQQSKIGRQSWRRRTTMEKTPPSQRGVRWPHHEPSGPGVQKRQRIPIHEQRGDDSARPPLITPGPKAGRASTRRRAGRHQNVEEATAPPAATTRVQWSATDVRCRPQPRRHSGSWNSKNADRAS